MRGVLFWCAEGWMQCGDQKILTKVGRFAFFRIYTYVAGEGKNGLIGKNKMYLKCSVSWKQCNWFLLAHWGRLPVLASSGNGFSIRQTYLLLTTSTANALACGWDYCNKLLTSPPATPIPLYSLFATRQPKRALQFVKLRYIRPLLNDLKQLSLTQ